MRNEGSRSLAFECRTDHHPRPLHPHFSPLPTDAPPPHQLSDVLGRKACLFSAACVSTAFAGAGAACTNYWTWLAMRALAGVGAAGTSLGAYVLATEAVGPRWHGAAGVATQIFFIGGEFLLVLLSVLFRSWRAQVRFGGRRCMRSSGLALNSLHAADRDGACCMRDGACD